MKNFVGKKLTKEVPFMGDKIEVRKLAVGETLELQKKVEKIKNLKGEAAQQAEINFILDVVRMSVEGADKMSDEELLSFPIEELTRISNAAAGVEATGNG